MVLEEKNFGAMHRANSFSRPDASPESELRKDQYESSLLHANLDFPGFHFFCFGKLQRQHAVLEVRGDFGLVDFLIQLELAEKVNQLIFTIHRFASARMGRF